MDRALAVQEYIKSVIVVACWDLLGKKTGPPLYEILGGYAGDTLPFYGFFHVEQSDAEIEAVVCTAREVGLPHLECKAIGEPVADREVIACVT